MQKSFENWITHLWIISEVRGRKCPSKRTSWFCPMEDPTSALIVFRNCLFLPKGLQNTSPIMLQWHWTRTVQKGCSWQRPQAQIIRCFRQSCSGMQPFAAIPARRHAGSQHCAEQTWSKKPSVKPAEQDQRLRQMRKQRLRILWAKQAPRVDAGITIQTGENESNVRQTDRQRLDQTRKFSYSYYPSSRMEGLSEPADYLPYLILLGENRVNCI